MQITCPEIIRTLTEVIALTKEEIQSPVESMRKKQEALKEMLKDVKQTLKSVDSTQETISRDQHNIQLTQTKFAQRQMSFERRQKIFSQKQESLERHQKDISERLQVVERKNDVDKELEIKETNHMSENKHTNVVSQDDNRAKDVNIVDESLVNVFKWSQQHTERSKRFTNDLLCPQLYCTSVDKKQYDLQKSFDLYLPQHHLPDSDEHYLLLKLRMYTMFDFPQLIS